MCVTALGAENITCHVITAFVRTCASMRLELGSVVALIAPVVANIVHQALIPALGALFHVLARRAVDPVGPVGTGVRAFAVFGLPGTRDPR